MSLLHSRDGGFTPYSMYSWLCMAMEWLRINQSGQNSYALLCENVLAWYYLLVPTRSRAGLRMYLTGHGRGRKYCWVRGEIQRTLQDYRMRKRFLGPLPVHQRGTKVRGSKMIRYHCSPNRKPCWQRMGIKPFLQIPPELKGNWKFMSSRGSIVARPKLKRIDGRAPPGVEFAA